MSTTHYTAVVEVNKTTHTPPPSASSNFRERHITPVADAPTRDVAEVAKLVIRDDSLKGLTAKLVAHIGILSEEGNA